MASHEEEDQDQFFDSCEELYDEFYSVWIRSPDSVQARRSRFMKWMSDDVDDYDVAVLRSSASASSSSSTSACSVSYDSVSEEDFEFKIKNLDDGSVFVVERYEKDGSLRGLREVGSDRSLSLDEFDRNFGSSSFIQKVMQRRDDNSVRAEKVERRNNKGWLRKMGNVACVVDRQEEEIDLNKVARRVKVHRCKKRSKDFSAVYTEQEIGAHDGAILTMKFSLDGELLASGGEDGVVRVWQVKECERSDDDELEYDPSCIYFKVNRNSELAPLYAADKEKLKSRSMRKTSDSACVVVPPQIFKISEKPIHEFHGHDGDVLDLSWSKDKYLLSSSTDKTVRLWKVGCDSCLNVFVHNNYVTCVQFNPTNENYFVSGSIDGKIRIWEVSQRRVVDWIDIRDIVTAVCYQPDGKRIVVGSMTGECRFYDVTDNVLELEVQISLQGKKKSSDKRITGFQYCPSDHQKLMVTSADSNVRILDGVDIISKYKGLRNAGSQISASFTLDGRHIISASEDSNVCIWTHDTTISPTTNHVKKTSSCERFISSHASVALPWQSQRPCQENQEKSSSENTFYLSPAGSFTLSNDIFSDGPAKVSATWPEEKLPSASAATSTSLRKSQYKFLKTSYRNSSHAWGQVIVTGGWDGRIRAFHNYGLPVNH